MCVKLLWKSYFLTSFRGLWGSWGLWGSIEQENNLQLFIRGNGAHGNRVSPNCARFDLQEKKGKENKEKYKIERQTKIKTRQKEPSQSKLCQIWFGKEENREKTMNETVEEEKRQINDINICLLCLLGQKQKWQKR